MSERARHGIAIVAGVWVLGYVQGRAEGRAIGAAESARAMLAAIMRGFGVGES